MLASVPARPPSQELCFRSSFSTFFHHPACSDARLFQTTLDALLAGSICDEIVLSLQDLLKSVEHFDEAARGAALLGESGNAEVRLAAVLEDCIQLAMEVDRLQM